MYTHTDKVHTTSIEQDSTITRPLLPKKRVILGYYQTVFVGGTDFMELIDSGKSIDKGMMLIGQFIPTSKDTTVEDLHYIQFCNRLISTASVAYSQDGTSHHNTRKQLKAMMMEFIEGDSLRAKESPLDIVEWTRNLVDSIDSAERAYEVGQLLAVRHDDVDIIEALLSSCRYSDAVVEGFKSFKACM